MSQHEALIKVKSKDYLLGYIDSLIFMKNQAGCERIDICNGQMITNVEQNKILGPVYLDLTCGNCGNYIAFKNGNEIPEKSFKCTLCEQVYMILYTDEKQN
jgi:hypothetical protein